MGFQFAHKSMTLNDQTIIAITSNRRHCMHIRSFSSLLSHESPIDGSKIWIHSLWIKMNLCLKNLLQSFFVLCDYAYLGYLVVGNSSSCSLMCKLLSQIFWLKATYSTVLSPLTELHVEVSLPRQWCFWEPLSYWVMTVQCQQKEVATSGVESELKSLGIWVLDRSQSLCFEGKSNSDYILVGSTLSLVLCGFGRCIVLPASSLLSL